ncbi:MAG: alpha/beta fold hydrolase [Thermomicrobiales bacterium]
MAYFEHCGSRIYYERHGDGDPVLLLPGFAQDGAELSSLRESLVAGRYEVIAADLPGSGRSGPQPRVYTATYYEDDARSLAALLQHLALEPAHLVGFSDGGEVALMLAAAAPGVARSVATWGAAGRLSDPDGRLRAAMYDVVDRPIPPLQGYRDFLVATYGEANARAMTRSHVAAVGAIIARGGDVGLAKASDIACPVLLIAGEQDMFASPALVSESAARIRDARMAVATGAGHDVHRARPEWLTQTLLAWLADH